MTHQTQIVSGQRMLTLKSGGWVVVIAVIISIALFSWAVAPALFRLVHQPPGDGKNIDSYGFDLSDLTVPRSVMKASLRYRDLVPVRSQPETIHASQISQYDSEHRGKWLVDDDQIIGVEINGEARAYPTAQLNVHEIINDQLGSVPIAVTYSPPTDSIRVFDRRMGETTMTFGVSGLLYNSNLLMYDVPPGLEPDQPAATASLWSQLTADAVSGPQAGATLTTIPAMLVRWSDWLVRHPNTTVVLPVPHYVKRYKKSRMVEYYQSDKYVAPVDPLPRATGLPPKSHVVVVESPTSRRVYPYSVVTGHANAVGRWSDTLDELTIDFDIRDNAAGQGHSIAVTDATTGEPLDVVHCLWFAWYSMYPKDAVAQ